MNVSWLWLRDFFPDGALDGRDAEELAPRLTEIGLTVDAVRPAFPAFSGVVLGKVLDARPHPDADRLSLCTVTAGDGERQVVCGAPNVEAGTIYGYATVGAKLPGGREIRRAKIRGVASEGMLCSAPELGLDALGSADGIWPVPGVAEADLGRDLRDALGLNDSVLEVDVPSNRGDLLSHLGVARELQWIVDADCRAPEAKVREEGRPVAGRLEIELVDPDGCPRYFARLVEEVRVGPSPAWLQIRLLAVGQRPVNNVVDATNYVMLERGQPLHPFDEDRLAGGRIVVRPAEEGTGFTTLDGRRRTLPAGATLICDAERPVAVGGVMGGLESEVADTTTSVLLESAWFDPARTGVTARRLGIASEAALRFARGVDPELTRPALDRAAALVADVAGGRVAPGVAGGEARPPAERPRVTLRGPRLARLVGREIELDEARAALDRLGFAPRTEGDAAIEATVPGWRFDVIREADLVEEVARLTGYGRIRPAPLPALPVVPFRAPGEEARDRLAAAARGAGFDEARTGSFVAAGILGPGVDNLVELQNPISKDERFLRPFVIATLGQAAAYNLRRGARRVKLFEVGHAFRAGEPAAAPRETRHVAFAAAGQRAPLDWSVPQGAEYDFFDLRGDLEDVLEAARGTGAEFRPSHRPYLHPGRQAEVVLPGGAPIGFCGELDPRLATEWGMEARLYVAELELEALTAPRELETARDVPREPGTERDLALIVPEDAPAAAVRAAVRAAGVEHLERLEVFDRYRGEQIPAGRVGLGLRLTFQAERTLTDDEVDEQIERLVEHLEEAHGYRLRGGDPG